MKTIEAFSDTLFSSFPEANLCYGIPVIVDPYPIYSIKTLQGYIFDDVFWDVFHSYSLHICHICWLANEKVYEIRFRLAA